MRSEVSKQANSDKSINLRVHWKSLDLSPDLSYQKERNIDKPSMITATPIFPTLLSKTGNKREPVISAPNLNWGMHHAKFVSMAAPASHQLRLGFHSFFSNANKLC